MRFILLFFMAGILPAAVLGTLRGVVHDPSHRPVADAEVVVKSASSDFSQKFTTNSDGAFEAALPVGEYIVTVTAAGFATAEERVAIASNGAPVLHVPLALASQSAQVTVAEAAEAVAPESSTNTTLVTRRQIADTPGADLTNSWSAITDYVPGSWVTHDQLHVRGGHQVTWAIDGVPIPNTNIASNVGPQIDPKDIDYLEAERGGYSAAYGDRTYGVFNVVPRTGFEYENQGELVVTGGSFGQTNDQVSFGGHTEKFAWFGSANGNRSDYGLETPGPQVLHDSEWGTGGMGSLIYNRGSSDQFRFFTSLRRDDYQVPNDPDAQAAGVRDNERERDALAAFSWVRTLRPGVILTVSPFYHYNRANYDGGTTVQHRGSDYGGAQATLTASGKHHNATAGVYGFGQHDNEFVAVSADAGSLAQQKISTGHLESIFAEDNYQPTNWLTLTAGLRGTFFSGAISENAASPRLGGSIRIPHLNWVLRGFWGEYYQAPPLSTVSGPLLQYAVTQGLGFIPLHGERDQEHQFGLAIPVHGWTLDFNNYHQRARNYFDHNNIGDSDVFFPLTIDGARLYGWEVSVRSPKIARRGEVYVTYAYAHAEGAGAINGGLIDFSPPESGYFLLDHDQRHTLHTGFNWNLPGRAYAAFSVYYGSGFTDGSSDVPAHLQPHTTADLSLGRQFADNLSVAVTALNIANRRFLLDNSETFGGTHYADPRQIYVELRYKFRF